MKWFAPLFWAKSEVRATAVHQVHASRGLSWGHARISNAHAIVANLLLDALATFIFE